MKRLKRTSFSQVPLERLAALPIEDLLELAKEADETLITAERLKNWINNAIILKKTKTNGARLYEQVTYY